MAQKVESPLGKKSTKNLTQQTMQHGLFSTSRTARAQEDQDNKGKFPYEISEQEIRMFEHVFFTNYSRKGLFNKLIGLLPTFVQGFRILINLFAIFYNFSKILQVATGDDSDNDSSRWIELGCSAFEAGCAAFATLAAVYYALQLGCKRDDYKQQLQEGDGEATRTGSCFASAECAQGPKYSSVIEHKYCYVVFCCRSLATYMREVLTACSPQLLRRLSGGTDGRFQLAYDHESLQI